MTSMNDECVYFCGPYKGYCGKAEYDSDAEIFHGEVVGTRDVVTFQGDSPRGLRVAFRESVDDYLDYCRERDERPEKPFSGKFVARIDPEIHRKLSALAELSGKSLNQFVCDCLESVAAGPPASSSSRPGPANPGGRIAQETRGSVGDREANPQALAEHSSRSAEGDFSSRGSPRQETGRNRTFTIPRGIPARGCWPPDRGNWDVYAEVGRARARPA